MFKLATISDQDRPVPILMAGDRYWPLSEVVPDLLTGDGSTGLMPVMDAWDAALPRLRAFVAAPVGPGKAATSGLRFLAPLLFPRKVICTGGNYSDHAAEMGLGATDKSLVRPAFFLKPPTTAVVGSGESVPYPLGVTQFDWEIEFAVVIGRHARHITAETALDYVAGYTVGLDLSARDLQFHPHNAMKMDVFGGKAFDGSCPLGPWIVPKEFIPDPQSLAFELRLNAEVKQSSNTRAMIWSIAEQIALISQVMTFEPGDVVLTGTPSGAGFKEGTFLRPGDKLAAHVDGIGTLQVQITPSISTF